MNNVIIQAGLNRYKRITKVQARKIYNCNKTIVLCPSNMRPFGQWHPEYVTDKSCNKWDTFENVVLNFEYYNCINTQTGKYTSFYIQVNA